MPTLELEEVTRTERELIDFLPEEGKKPVVCIFDPIALHAVIIDFVLAELLDKVEIFWQGQFSRTFIEMAGITEEIYPTLIAMKKPVLLISELEVIPGEYLYGIEMLQSLRRTVGLKNTPLVVVSNVISDKKCLAEAEKESRIKLEELKVSGTFTWNELQRKKKEQKRLFNIVSQILSPKQGL